MSDPRREALLLRVEPDKRPLVAALLDYIVSLIEKGRNQHRDDHQFIERRSDGNTKRIHEVEVEIANIAQRLHELENAFEQDGVISQLTEGLYRISVELEKYRDDTNPQQPT